MGVWVDCAAVLCVSPAGDVLTVKRAKAPLRGHWTLPGGRLDEGEPPEIAALRELREETGLEGEDARFLGEHTFSGEGYQFRTKIFAVLRCAGNMRAGDDASEVAWKPPLVLEGENSAWGLINKALTLLHGGSIDQLVVLLSDLAEPIDVAWKSRIHTSATPLHLAFSCLIRNDEGRLLLARRALEKLTFPGVWTGACCGHPYPGESLDAAVARRVQMELGVEIHSLELAESHFRYTARDTNGTLENEVCPVFVAQIKDVPRPAIDEVMEIAWVDSDLLFEIATRGPELISPWLRDQLRLPSVRLALSAH